MPGPLERNAQAQEPRTGRGTEQSFCVPRRNRGPGLMTQPQPLQGLIYERWSTGSDGIPRELRAEIEQDESAGDRGAGGDAPMSPSSLSISRARPRNTSNDRVEADTSSSFRGRPIFWPEAVPGHQVVTLSTIRRPRLAFQRGSLLVGSHPHPTQGIGCWSVVISDHDESRAAKASS